MPPRATAPSAAHVFPASPPRTPAQRRAARVRRMVVRLVVFGTLFVGVVAGAAWGVATVLDRDTAGPGEVRCAASLEGVDWFLATDQAETVALLAGMAQQRALPARALTIAIATGLQESKLRNIDHGDRDSIGIFQQRPSQGWGTEEEILDPVYSTGRFYDALVQVPGYEELPVTEAAQAVQRSAFPDAYAQHEASARAWANAMYGYSPAAVTCTLEEAEGPGDAQGVVDRAQRDLGIPATASAAGVVLDAAPLIADPEHAERVGWAVAHWAVTVAQPFGVDAVHHAGSTWTRESGAWSTPTKPDPQAELPPGQVLVVLAD